MQPNMRMIYSGVNSYVTYTQSAQGALDSFVSFTGDLQGSSMKKSAWRVFSHRRQALRT